MDVNKFDWTMGHRMSRFEKKVNYEDLQVNNN